MKSFLSIVAVGLLLYSTSLIAQTNPDFETDSISEFTIVACYYISDNEGWLADDEGNLLKTTNGGDSWNSNAVAIEFKELQFIDALNGFGITSSAAYKTVNGGTSWTLLSLPGEMGRALYFINSTTGFVSGDEVIYKTTDGGSNWTTISTEGVSFTDFFFINSTAGIATAHDENNYQCIWRTADAGSTWANVFSEEDFFFNTVWFTIENVGWAAVMHCNPAD